MKKVLVTAALPYANGPLHLGHIRSTYLPADIFVRFQRSMGNDAIYVCATDEHGTPIVTSAEVSGKSPEEFVRYYHEKDKMEFERLGFSFDIFHRTSSMENKEMAQHFFLRLKENGYLYEKEVEQAYCVRCKRFLPDRFVVGKCPHCGAEGIYSDYCEMCGRALRQGELLEPKCITCGNKPVVRKSRHYFLKLSAFSKKLERWLKENKNLQQEVVHYVLNWIKEGLQDWDITRDMDWGVPVPGEKGKVLYVWFDAPIGYVSSTKAWAERESRSWEEWWKGDAEIYHFIGKDIIYHHYLFWPAILMGIEEGFRLPDHIPTRGYLNLEGKKFSKSRGWFVSLDDFLNEFPADYLRYYETMITGYDLQDADFLWKDFQKRINNELVANVGNFIYRTLVMLKKKCGSRVPEPKGLDERDEAMLRKIGEMWKRTTEEMERIRLRRGLEELMSLSSELNKYLSEKEPWKEEDQRKVDNCIYVCMRGVTALGIMLEPFLPFSAKRLFSMLGIGDDGRGWELAPKEILEPGKEIGEIEPLFHKISDADIDRQIRKLRS